MKADRWMVVLVAVMAIGVATACSVADTSPSQIALHYANGPFSSRVFEDCVNQSTLAYQGVADDHFYYPVGQRSLNFGEGGDFPPLSITSRDGQVMTVNAIVAFHLNTSCVPFTEKRPDGQPGKTWPGGLIQKFHETIATQDEAYATGGGGEPGPGWIRMLRKYLAAPTERGVSNQALGFGWLDLFTNPDTKAAWERQSVAEIPQLVLAQTGEPYFVIDSILLQKPVPNSTLQAELSNNQAAALRAKTAATDQAAAANFPGGISAYIAYQAQLAVNKAITDGKVAVVPIPFGSPVQINAGGGR